MPVGCFPHRRPEIFRSSLLQRSFGHVNCLSTAELRQFRRDHHGSRNTRLRHRYSANSAKRSWAIRHQRRTGGCRPADERAMTGSSGNWWRTCVANARGCAGVGSANSRRAATDRDREAEIFREATALYDRYVASWRPAASTICRRTPGHCRSASSSVASRRTRWWGSSCCSATCWRARSSRNIETTSSCSTAVFDAYEPAANRIAIPLRSASSNSASA